MYIRCGTRSRKQVTNHSFFLLGHYHFSWLIQFYLVILSSSFLCFFFKKKYYNTICLGRLGTVYVCAFSFFNCGKKRKFLIIVLASGRARYTYLNIAYIFIYNFYFIYTIHKNS
ncbi:hypothetical protein BD770DRAFT_387997, partial [Pilaira anomala]